MGAAFSLVREVDRYALTKRAASGAGRAGSGAAQRCVARHCAAPRRAAAVASASASPCSPDPLPQIANVALPVGGGFAIGLLTKDEIPSW
jgi:hypothetical protein